MHSIHAVEGWLPDLQADHNRRVSPILGHYVLPEDRWAEAVQEHEAILEAFTARDGKRLGEILRTHIMSKFAAIAEQLPSELD